MSVEENTALVRRYVEDALNDGDLTVINETHEEFLNLARQRGLIK